MAAKDYTSRMLGQGRRFGHGNVLACLEWERQRNERTARINRVRNEALANRDEANEHLTKMLRAM